MMITNHPHMKNIHNSKKLIFQNFKFPKYNFKMFKFQESFAKCKWVIMCMTYEQNCGLRYKKFKLQVIIIFLYDLKF
jgi:hypothetical protein